MQNDYGMTAAQRWYDNQLPQRYSERPLYQCIECGEDIYAGEICYVFSRGTKLCERCVDLHRETAEEENE